MAAIPGMWTRERTTILIGLYEKHELLYNPKLLGYRNKDKRKGNTLQHYISFRLCFGNVCDGYLRLVQGHMTQVVIYRFLRLILVGQVIIRRKHFIGKFAYTIHVLLIM